MATKGAMNRPGRPSKAAKSEQASALQAAPALEATPESCAAYIAWANAELAADRIQSNKHAKLIDGAKAMNAVVRTKNSREEMSELRDLVARAEKAQEALQGAAVAARYGQAGPGDGGLYGEWRRAADGTLEPVEN